MDKLSYALGLSMGHNFLGTGVKELNIEDFANGLRAVYEGADKLMTFAEAKQVVTDYFNKLEEGAADDNARLGKELQYMIVKEGTGIRPGKNDSVTVHYTGRLIDGTVFDSSVERGEPATFGVGQVIPGWVEGLQLMQEGAAYRFFIPSELAYGKYGTGPIQPNSTLIFDVQLIKVNK